ncbi:MAG: hypothetical protein AABZ32_08095 [Bacteroidota bacterium]
MTYAEVYFCHRFTDLGLSQKYPSLRGRFDRSNPTEIFWEIAAPQSGLAMTLLRKSCDYQKKKSVNLWLIVVSCVSPIVK